MVADEVLIAEFAAGGGFISYIKEDDQFLHTLNTGDGFRRKLDHLGIVLPDTK